MNIRRIALLLVGFSAATLGGCVTVTHKVDPIDITLHIKLDDKLNSFFDYQDKPAPAPTAEPTMKGATS